ncbi:MAG: CcoQ/FixQ family Cbb3-type cytochrome c oxidase assembly chaperone [Gemmatimonadetes bacterium]|jgi:cbb3-type cytochrome oxidase subunit 3|nr:CcoQ/FixQ family Cbb3-type cytochrome c oxidase assembly chaperone [Gemmatimonadota bacterium]MBT4612768.1 CcoQ/FixQ family Cbb3-type cytochrome c oxidase assembly chaperone [Gemmatimonadota bacterium]MBT5058938.1 CcoQ/FixQ family Cbb3-type cytochrome c oxidase assembly chaperone [Gemmatimonadota bacterium]MBT5142936.1 CcoQ/FixQ family Cbb3-type cytochrome c oxidase assembly chaperone [Gemmatimonadota bacterium]MBT5589530.1 CcoQ/FixQ family Cbb3-type cytochrome c oxidase assembly chaperone [
MYKEVLASIDGVAIYPIISLVIFFTFFVGLLAWFVLADRTRLQRFARLPLDDDNADKEATSHG